MIDKVPIQLSNGNTIILHHVWHVLELKRCLVSVKKLVEARYKMMLSEWLWQINKRNMKIKYDKLYPLNVISLEGTINVAKVPDATLWHG